MPLVDVRPGELDLLYRSGTQARVAITWPAGYLTGKTWTSTLDGVVLSVGIVGDIMTITVTDAQTVAAASTATWVLTDTTAGVSDDILAGQWTKSTKPTAASNFTTTVVIGGQTVTIDVSGAAGLAAHTASTTAHGNPLAALQTHKDRLHIPFVTRPAGWGQWWETARTQAGSRQVIVQGWGDSVMVGQAATDPRTQGWFGLTIAALQAQYGDGGTGYLPWGLTSVAAVGAWTAAMGFGGTQGTATAAASLTYNDLRGTRVRIFHRNVTSPTGTYRYILDGGAPVNVTPPTGAAVEPGVTEITGLTDTPHTLVLEWVSGTIGFYGVECTRATGIVPQRCAVSGRAAVDYSKMLVQRINISTTNGSPTITAAGAGVFTSTMIGKFLAGTGLPTDGTITAVASPVSATISANASATGATTAELCLNPPSRASVAYSTANPPFGLAPGLGRPDLLIVVLSVNDGANVNNTPPFLVEGLSSIVAPHTSDGNLNWSPDVVFGIAPLGTWFDTQRFYPAYAGAIGGLASGLGAAVVDSWGRWRRSWKYASDQGWMNDVVHPNTAGHVNYAQPYIDLLTAAA